MEFANNIDKTLFDFDDDIDNLSEVEERYKAFPTADIESKEINLKEQVRSLPRPGERLP